LLVEYFHDDVMESPSPTNDEQLEQIFIGSGKWDYKKLPLKRMGTTAS
jgi:hypothetical protein